MKNVLITGCSSGFGKEAVKLFLKDGWLVFATTRTPEKLSDYSNHYNLCILPQDVAIAEGRLEIGKAIQEHCTDGLHCLINNAGYGLAGPFELLDEAQIRQQFEVNFFAPLFLTQALLPSLRKAKGRIINLSSVLGYTGMPMQSMYAASKFAIEGLSESLYYELATQGIQVSLVEPGGYRTAFAKSMVFPGDQQLNSPIYQQQFSGYQQFLSKVSTQGKGKPPRDVASLLLSLANTTNMPLRVRIGQDAQALYYLRKTLPQKLADKVLKRIGNNILKAKQ